MKLGLIRTLLLMILLSGCATLESVSVTQIPAKRTDVVSATSSKWIIFFFNFSNEYADKVSNDLKAKCEGGQIKGILTKDENYNYFLGFVMKRQITATGYCLKGQA